MLTPFLSNVRKDFSKEGFVSSLQGGRTSGGQVGPCSPPTAPLQRRQATGGSPWHGAPGGHLSVHSPAGSPSPTQPALCSPRSSSRVHDHKEPAGTRVGVTGHCSGEMRGRLSTARAHPQNSNPLGTGTSTVLAELERHQDLQTPGHPVAAGP